MALVVRDGALVEAALELLRQTMPFPLRGLIPLRLLEEIRSVQYHLAALAAGQTTHVPRAEGN